MLKISKFSKSLPVLAHAKVLLLWNNDNEYSVGQGYSSGKFSVVSHNFIRIKSSRCFT